MKFLVRIRLIAIAILLVAVSGGVSYRLGQKSVQLTAAGKADLTMFWDVWSKLETNYLDKGAIDPQKMIYGAISGMTAALDDPYTSFFPPVENTRSKEDLSGEFSGVGIQLGFVDKTLAVVAPLPGNPAERAGIKAGDLILHIKDEAKGLDKDTNGINLLDAVDYIRGRKGSSVTLTPTAGTDIPNDDAGGNIGNDFFVVLRTSSTTNYRDSFVVTLGPGAVTTTSGVSDSEMAVTTDAITCRVPTFFTNLTSLTQQIAAGDTVTVFGINMRDYTTAGADGGDKLTKITVAFSNSGGDFDFTSNDLASVNDTTIAGGVTLWADLGVTNVGSFDRATDGAHRDWFVIRNR